MPELTPKLLAAYRATWIDVDLPLETFTVPPADQGKALDLPEELQPWFVVITAFNPGSEALTDDENQARHAELWGLVRSHAELWNVVRSVGDDCFQAVGRSEDGSWREESVAIVGVEEKRALALAQRFGQLAVFCVDEKGCEVVQVPAGVLSMEIDEEQEDPDPRCPSCGSEDVVHVAYGLVMLNEAGERAVEAGRMRLGGCIVGPDSYEFECNECPMRWNGPERLDSSL
jgi:hypothetical protein